MVNNFKYIIYINMYIENLFKDKTVKAKAKVTQVGEWLLDGTLPTDELLAFAEQQQK
jgi:hypothetical protein